MIERYYKLEKLLDTKKVLIIYGARRTGKTTLLKSFLSKTHFKYKEDNGENLTTRLTLSSGDAEKIRQYGEGYELLALDEAQYIPKIGMGLKILKDHLPALRIVVTGSSSFGLSQTAGEPLTGRKRTLVLFPFSQLELLNKYNRHELKNMLEEHLIFGSYPEVVTAKSREKKIMILKELVDSYLLRDVLAMENLRAPVQLVQLLKLIALQTGSEVSLNELSGKVGLDVKTIGRYLDLLEKGFIIHRVGGFSRNLRTEVTSKAKYFFLDNGIRNAVISQFQMLDNRADTGALFENFIVMERIKLNEIRNRFAGIYFWRTHAGAEVDLVEEIDGKLRGFEIKWSPSRRVLPPALWKETYPDSGWEVVNRENFLRYMV